MRSRTKILPLVMILGLILNQLNAQKWEIKTGESLQYKVAFSSGMTGSVKGGEATLSVKPSTTKIGNITVYQASLKGGTTGIIEWFYQVSNNYETFINTQIFITHLYSPRQP